jgi:hypothetical protein
MRYRKLLPLDNCSHRETFPSHVERIAKWLVETEKCQYLGFVKT